MEVGSSVLSVLLRPGARPGSKKAWSSATFMMNFTTRLIVSALKAELGRRQDL